MATPKPIKYIVAIVLIIGVVLFVYFGLEAGLFYYFEGTVDTIAAAFN